MILVAPPVASAPALQPGTPVVEELYRLENPSFRRASARHAVAAIATGAEQRERGVRGDFLLNSTCVSIGLEDVE